MLCYSIIIPHKNIPHLLQRCLDSIPRREDIQIIVVDDNSDVDKVDFENFPGLYDPHVEVIFGKNENGRKGAGYARNLGLERAKGKWVTFIDADDFFQPSILEAINKYIDSPLDMVCFYMTSVDSDNINRQTDRGNWIIKLLDEAKKTNHYDLIRYNYGCVWGRFIKLELIRTKMIRFQETMYRNDTMFAAQLGCSAHDILIDELPIYCYTYRKNSTIQIDTAEAVEIRYQVSKSVMQYLRKQRKGYSLFNKDLVYSWFDLRNIKFKLFMYEFPVVFLLSTTKKNIIVKFVKTLKGKI